MIKEEATTPFWNSKHLGKFHDNSCLLEDVRCVVDGYSSCCCMCEFVTHVERIIWICSVIKVKLFQLQTHIHRKGFVRLRPRSMAQRSSRTPLSCMLLFTSSLWQIFVNRLTMSILFPSTYVLWCLYMFSSSFPFLFFVVSLQLPPASSLTPSIHSKNRWGHCKSMKPAWDQLGDEFAGSSSVLIGDVDCTADGEELCSKFEVS
jgi:hypothetical protein